jgi:hypothetical protein
MAIFETMFPMAEQSSSIESPFMTRAFLSLAEKMERFAIISPWFTNIYLFMDFVNPTLKPTINPTIKATKALQ